MSKLTKPAPPVIVSKNILDYKLSKRLLAPFSEWEKMKAYMALANRKPTNIRLRITDYNDINAAVRAQSDDKRRLSDLNYKGFPILSVEKSSQTDAFA